MREHRAGRRVTSFSLRTRLLAAGALGAFVGVVMSACASEESSQTTSGGASSSSSGMMACEPGATLPCYTGPIVTEGVGVCKGGSRTCNAEGTAFGICEGQVTPLADDCATPEDEDCDGTPAPACAGTSLFGAAFGSASDDLGRAIAIDASGAMIVTGYVGGQAKGADFGGGPLTAGGGRDLFVVKLDASGAHVWSKGFGDAADQEGAAVAVDASGAALVTGFFGGVLDFGGGSSLTSKDTRDAFVVKLAADGSVVWAKAYGDATGPQQGAGIAAAPNGDVLVAGSFSGSIDLGSGPLTSAGGADIFVARLDGATGAVVWAKSFGDIADQRASAIAADASGDAIITGAFRLSVDFGSGPLTSAGGDDVFVVKLDASGAPVFAQRYGDAIDQAGVAVAVDGAGGVVVGGSFKGSLDAGGGALTSAGDDDLFLVKLDASGAHQWSKAFGDPSSQVLGALAVDASGAIGLTGKFTGSLDLGHKPPLPSTKVYDIFAAKLDPTGAYLWGHVFGGPFDQIGLGAALSGAGEVAITGTFFGSVDFAGGDPKASAGLSDLFIAKFAP